MQKKMNFFFFLSWDRWWRTERKG